VTAVPSHHGPDGRFRNPWPGEDAGKRRFGEVLRWQLQRMRHGVPPTPPPAAFPRGTPAIAATLPAREKARITWVGHSTFLIQLPSHNLLTDPVWSNRVSPVRGIGPRRITQPGISLDDLPQIDTVLLSHDHSDHLDEPTVRALHARYGDSTTWITPLNYAAWLERRGIRNVAQLDWWEGTRTGGSGSEDTGSVEVRALPARHWTQRTMRDAFRRLWCSFSIEAAGTRIYFGGDSGYGPFYREIGQREKPFDVVLLPIGAYDPRWFMKPAHMNPEEAVEAYRDLGGHGTFVPMHWGTFRLADDPPLEAPVRVTRAWSAAGLPAQLLAAPRHGDTVIIK
jgi:N-acyl-phosphatidylethanolamine-hydrolysing phospholipase D